VIQSEPVVIPDELVKAARQGETSALLELWERCEPIVHESIARSRGTRVVEAAEVAQEAALVLLTILREPPLTPFGLTGPKPTSFAEIYRRKLQVRIRTYLRAERRRAFRTVTTTSTLIENLLARRVVPGTPFTTERSGRTMARAMERLSPRQRAVVAGLYFRDQNVDSVATELSISHQAVTALNRRALTVLRGALALEEPTEPPAQSDA
jgi:RNA polymerase sigma factor (sigma-70 family)